MTSVVIGCFDGAFERHESCSPQVLGLLLNPKCVFNVLFCALYV